MKRPLVLLAVFLAGGCWACYLCGESIIILFALSIALIISLGVFLRFRRNTRRQKRYETVVLALALTLFATGYLRTGDRLSDFRSLSEFGDRSDVTLYGRIDGVSATGDTCRINLKDCYFYYEGRMEAFDYGIAVACSEGKGICGQASDYHIGDIYSFFGDFSLYETDMNPGEFNSFFYYAVRGVGGSFYAEKAERLASGWAPVGNLLIRVKDYVRKTFAECFDEVDAAQLLALTTGDKSELSDGMKDMYQRNGIMHIMAISGLHISIAGFGLYRLLRRIRLKRNLCFAAAFASALFYAGLTGFSISSIRALIMLFVFLLGEYKGKSYDSVSALALAGLISLLANPCLAFDSGFQLSFGAVVGIGGVLPVLSGAVQSKYKENRLSSDYEEKYHALVRGCHYRTNELGETGKRPVIRRLVFRLFRSLLPGVSVYLVILPVLLSSYYELPVYALLLNTMVAPLMSPLLIACIMLMLCFGLSTGMATFIAGVPHCILLLYEKVCGLAEALPFHSLLVGKPSPVSLVLYYAGLILVLYYVNHKEKEYLQVRMAVSAVLMAIILLPPIAHGAKTEFLYVGQGDGACITMDGGCFLVDCGSTSKRKLFRYVLSPYLKSRGIGIVRGWFLTHSDEDHTSCIREVLGKLKERGVRKREQESFSMTDYGGDILLEEIYLPYADAGFEEIISLASEVGIKVCNLYPGDEVRLGEMKFICQSPSCPLHTASDNEHSLVLTLSYKDKPGLLFTGDISGEEETRLAERLSSQMLPLSILKVAHHGSRYSSGEAFLKAATKCSASFEDEVKGRDGPDSKSGRQSVPVSVKAPERYAIISAGKKNLYRHPHTEALERLKASGFSILELSKTGAVSIDLSQNNYPQIMQYRDKKGL